MAPDGRCLKRAECSCRRCVRALILKHRGGLLTFPADHAARHRPVARVVR